MPRVLQDGEVIVSEQELAAMQASNWRMHDALSVIAELRRDQVQSATVRAAHALAQETTLASAPRWVPAERHEALRAAAQQAIDAPAVMFEEAIRSLRRALQEDHDEEETRSDHDDN